MPSPLPANSGERQRHCEGGLQGIDQNGTCHLLPAQRSAAHRLSFIFLYTLPLFEVVQKYANSITTRNVHTWNVGIQGIEPAGNYTRQQIITDWVSIYYGVRCAHALLKTGAKHCALHSRFVRYRDWFWHFGTASAVQTAQGLFAFWWMFFIPQFP